MNYNARKILSRIGGFLCAVMLLNSTFPCISFATDSDIVNIENDMSTNEYAHISYGTVYSKYILDDNSNLSKNLFLNDICIAKGIIDFCADNQYIAYSSDDDLYLYDIQNGMSNNVCTDVQLRDLMLHGKYIYGVDDSEGLSQLCVIDSCNSELIKTNYTNVNAFTVFDDGLNIDMKLPISKLKEIGTDKIDVSTYSAVVDSEEINYSDKGLDNILNNSDNNISLFSSGNIDMPVLMATVTLSSLQPAMFVMDTLYVTQGAYSSYSHSDDNAFDLDGSLGGGPAANVKAPFDGKIKYKANESRGNCHAVWFESNSIVQYANGNTGYMTVLVMHDDDISNVYEGQGFSQGQTFYQEGSYGLSNVTGQHLHLECINGTAGSYAWHKRGNVYPNDALYLYSNTNVQNKGGYTWRTWSGSVIPEVPTYPGEPIKYVVCNTNDASNITATSAIFNGTFTNPAGAKIIKRGYQWGATPEMCNYTVFDCNITWADGLTHNMMGLSPNTTYYYKLVVQDENGNYIYGNTKSFTTLSSGIEKVICNTGDAYNISATSAVLNGTFTNPSGARIVKRGFQWGATPEMCNFTVFDCDITWVDGLNHNMINLAPNTTYYYKLIVKGENGDYIYGNTKSFKTLPAPDTENPIITNLTPRYISGKSFAIKCNLYDNTDVTRVWLVIYSPNGEHQFGVNASNGDFSYTINTSDYGGAGYYSIHMYAFDANDNSSGMFSTGQFLVADDTIPPKLTNLSVSNVGDKVFEVNCNLWDNVDVTRLWMVIYCPKGEFQFAIPAKQGDFTYPIDTDIYGGLGEYVIHLYAFDDAENSSGMVSTGSIIPQYYIGYDANGGTGAPDTQVKKYGESLIIDSMQPVRAGYIFKGWSNISDSTEANYYPGESFEGNYDLMLYACWEPMSFKITFDANFVGVSETIKTVYYNSTYGDMPVLSKEGFAFLGWFTDPLYGSLITADTTVSILENQILYAHWEKLIPYTESTVTKSGAKLIIDTKVHNITAPYDILIVGYKNNKFVTMRRVPHDEQNSPYTLEGDVNEIKVMVWNGVSTLKPLCDAEEIPNSKWMME